MSPCTEVEKRLAELARRSADTWPVAVQEHLAECPFCARAVWAQRIMQETVEGLLFERKLRRKRGRDDGRV